MFENEKELFDYILIYELYFNKIFSLFLFLL